MKTKIVRKDIYAKKAFAYLVKMLMRFAMKVQIVARV